MKAIEQEAKDKQAKNADAGKTTVDEELIAATSAATLEQMEIARQNQAAADAQNM